MLNNLSKNGILSKRDYKCHLLGASKHGVYTQTVNLISCFSFSFSYNYL